MADIQQISKYVIYVDNPILYANQLPSNSSGKNTFRSHNIHHVRSSEVAAAETADQKLFFIVA
jgi:hypothetical protein